MNEHRYKALEITDDLLMMMLTDANEIHCRVSSDIPDGAKIASKQYAPDRGMVRIVLEHPSWPIVADGQEIPYTKPAFTRLDCKAVAG